MICDDNAHTILKKNPSTCSEKLPFMFGEVNPKDSPNSVGFAFCCLPEVKSKSLLLKTQE